MTSFAASRNGVLSSILRLTSSATRTSSVGVSSLVNAAPQRRQSCLISSSICTPPCTPLKSCRAHLAGAPGRPQRINPRAGATPNLRTPQHGRSADDCTQLHRACTRVRGLSFRATNPAWSRRRKDEPGLTARPAQPSTHAWPRSASSPGAWLRQATRAPTSEACAHESRRRSSAHPRPPRASRPRR